MLFSVYTKIRNINFFLVFFLIYFLSYPIFSQNDDNSNILNSNEEIKAEFGNWLQICENEKNQSTTQIRKLSNNRDAHRGIGACIILRRHSR